ncbi:MAG: hypothetical protein ACRDIY_16685 [Chloroflexota bacterium]
MTAAAGTGVATVVVRVGEGGTTVAVGAALVLVGAGTVVDVAAMSVAVETGTTVAVGTVDDVLVGPAAETVGTERVVVVAMAGMAVAPVGLPAQPTTMVKSNQHTA